MGIKEKFEWDAEKLRPGCVPMKPISMETMIAITEKLKELNGVSDVQIEIKRLESRLAQLEMMNTANLTKQQVQAIVNEVYLIKGRVLEIGCKTFESNLSSLLACKPF